MVLERKVDLNSEICGVQLKDRKCAKELMLNLNKRIDQLAMVSSWYWYGGAKEGGWSCLG